MSKGFFCGENMTDRENGRDSENRKIIQNRVFEAIVGLGGGVRVSRFDADYLQSLKNARSFPSSAVLRQSIRVDLNFAERTGLELNPDLTQVAKELLNQKKGGGDDGS